MEGEGKSRNGDPERERMQQGGEKIWREVAGARASDGGRVRTYPRCNLPMLPLNIDRSGELVLNSFS